MALTTFIPELWEARLQRNLEKAHVALALVNRDYEGEIKQMGDTVHVNFIGPVTISDYNDANGLSDPEVLDTTDQTLVIDKQKFFNFRVSDIDKVQAAGHLMDSAMAEAAYGIADKVDTDIFTAMANAATVAKGNRLAHATITTPDQAYGLLVALRTQLSKQNVPMTGRKVAVSPEFIELLLNDKSRFAGIGSEKANERLENGYVGRAAGFDIYESNNIPTFGENNYHQVIAAVPAATSFAEQLAEVEAYRPEKFFSDAVKGLNLYGVKVFRDKCIAAVDFELGN